MTNPLITCIMPTADRPEFVMGAVNKFLRQDYSNTELVIIDDGVKSCVDLIPNLNNINYYYLKPPNTIGTKRNLACEKSNGEFIIHMDDDDWYAPDWISRQVENLLNTGGDITGLNSIIFHSSSLERSFVYRNVDNNKPWILGATMAYKKSVWENYKFKNMQVGEDTDFLKNSAGKIVVLNYLNGFVAMVHSNNTSIKYVERNPLKWKNKITIDLQT